MVKDLPPRAPQLEQWATRTVYFRTPETVYQLWVLRKMVQASLPAFWVFSVYAIGHLPRPCLPRTRRRTLR